MPRSYSYFKSQIKQWFIDNVPLTTRILDVGPGQGTYSDLLRDLGYRIDAVEIWAPYISQFNLRAKYDNVYVADILNFDIRPYDFIILGDVLEHIPTDKAQGLLTNFDLMGKRFLVAVPYMMSQNGADHGNEYETHHQADLTPDVMLDRYPGLEKLYNNKWYGYYVNMDMRYDKAYVLYATESYKDTVQACVASIRRFSDLPIMVYMLNSDVDIDGAITFRWDCKTKDLPQQKYIDRSKSDIYRILIQRPLIVKDALKHAHVVAYVDSDSVATKCVDRIFDYFPEKSSHPYFTEGIYDWMVLNGRGGADSRDDLSTTLEHPACELFGIDQSVRDKYRQTGYFVASEWCKEFLDEWWWMCNHPKVLQNPQYYAPYHEETIVNTLLWKYNFHQGLPYIYVNGGVDRVNKAYDGNTKYTPGTHNNLGHFFRLPDSRQDILFFHGEKDAVKMKEISDRIDFYNRYNIDPKKNWGDVISNRIVSHFTTKKIDPANIFHFDEKAIIPKKDGKLLAVGSVMVFAKKNDYVWGTGVISDKEVNIKEHPKKIYAVRGPISRKELVRAGIECPEVYGDPALLFPRIYQPNVSKKYKYGIIPHYSEYQNTNVLNTLYKLEEIGIKVINITAGIEQFVDEVNECQYIISSSLHGVIVADAYRIPNVRVCMSNTIVGGDFKYMDYFASVKREYQHKPIWVTEDTTLEDIEKFPYEVGDISCADDLLVNAPWKDPECTLFTPTKILFVAPHLSTGGMPAFLLRRIQALVDKMDVYVVEYSNHSDHYVVQKNQIKQLVNHFYTLGENKMELIDIIKNNAIDVVHVEEMVEDGWNNWPEEVRQALYNPDRTWRMIETCHNIVFKPDVEKRYHPDAYAFCTPHHLKTFENMPSMKEVIEFPIEKKQAEPVDLGPGKHVLNVGLWTPGKNQGEAVELARQMPDVHFHFLGNQAGNFQHYWEPIMKNIPPNVHVWGERDDVGGFMAAADVFLFNSTFECNPLVLREAIGYGLPILARNLPQYGDMFTQYITDLKPEKLKEQLYNLLNLNPTYIIPERQSEEFAQKHINLYQEVVRKPIQAEKEIINITHTFVHEPFLEITGTSKSTFTVKYFDERGACRYENQIKTNHWVRLNRRWYMKWTIKVWKDDDLYYEYTLNYENQRVHIAFDSSSLGDTIAWMPYVLEFKKKHNCHVIVSTFKNFLFKDVYPELEFVEPGTNVTNILGMYSIGWFYDINKEPELCNTIPLQKTATNILGLHYQELKPRIAYTPTTKFDGKIVTIATNSTAGCKFWTKEAWQEVINFLDEKGYRVINISKEDNPFENCQPLDDKSMQNTMDAIASSEFFIGLSSGLSWLAWAMEKPVVMIANFTEENHEFSCIRITDKSVCHGCWNKSEFKFDKGDWDWCPVHKNSPRQFECQRAITSDKVKDAILSIMISTNPENK